VEGTLPVKRLSRRRRDRSQVELGAADPSLTGAAGLLAVGEVCRRLDVVAALDAHVGPVKSRARGASTGELLVELAGAQLAGEDFLVGMDRRRADRVGAECFGMAGIPSTTAASLARRLGAAQREGIEAGVAEVLRRVVELAPARRQAQLRAAPTLDVDATEVEVYGRAKGKVAYNYQGQRTGRPHLVSWAQAGVALAADLLSGDEDPRAGVVALVRRAMVGLPPEIGGRPVGRPRVRADAGSFSGEMARGVLAAGADFAVGVKRNPAVWRAAAAVPEAGWVAAVDMPSAEVAVCGYQPDGWPEGTVCVVRRVRVPAEQVSADPRSRRRRTIPKEQLTLALDGRVEVVYGYSFILTNLDVATPRALAAFERWYRDRADIEDRIRDAKHGAALRHLPSGDHAVNAVWMWGALLAVNLSAWLQELAGLDNGRGRDRAHAGRLRRELFAAAGRLVRHARRRELRLAPDQHELLTAVLARLRALPAPT
jgi:hypothetical protein